MLGVVQGTSGTEGVFVMTLVRGVNPQDGDAVL